MLVPLPFEAVPCKSANSFKYYFFHQWVDISDSGRSSHVLCRPVFRLGNGRLLCNVQSLIFRILSQDPTFRFAIIRPEACFKVLLIFSLLARSRFCSFWGPGRD
jgi:hypothetical protein